MARPATGRAPIFNFRMDYPLRKALEKAAADKGLTITAFIRMVLTDATK
jgi:antitoxin component of RelBE/YafQ-DinJ toxin-antitoxin module